MIERINVNAATCDACGTTRYSEGEVIQGFTVTVFEVDGLNTFEYKLFACKRAHIAKAVRAQIDQTPNYGNANGEAEGDTAGLTQADFALR